MAFDLDQLREELENGEEVKVTETGEIVPSHAPERGTRLKPSTWANR